MKNSILIIVFSFLLFNCSSEDASVTSTMTAVETTLIGKGNLYGGSSQGVNQQNLVITNETDWNALITLFDAVNTVSDSFSETAIDFSAFTVIAAIDEIQGSGGHALDIEVNSSSTQVMVTVIDISPQGNATTVITQPYHIVKIPKTNLPIVFQ
ncbi:protease complex subunit PrcB family protein [Kordia jejudonensis]|uniref:protease complex subunit PrcB family protein n=1 Tax=Kordia jejudonensis TaxID=1348245 RepID=UPI000629B571|nr:protease complex subunit PrcB family protein [Kordia jejudonensis]